MSDEAKAQIEADYANSAVPSWVETVMVLTGVALLIGPTLGVL